MAIPTFNAIGFCAHYSDQGDWAFDFALRISESTGNTLNVFHFLTNPYDPDDNAAEKMSPEERERMAVEREKELRMYYDDRAGEYLDVGFRVCYDNSWIELHRCLLIREFQILVLGYPHHGAYFAKKSIEDFANSFISPVVLVGPDSPDEFYLNKQAFLIIDKLGLDPEKCHKLEMETA